MFSFKVTVTKHKDILNLGRFKKKFENLHNLIELCPLIAKATNN